MTAIIGIDPGTTRSAWVLLRAGSIHTHGIADNETLLADLYGISSKDADVAVIEMVSSYGMRYVGSETYETCVWIGRFIEALHPLPVQRITRPDVKAHLLGSPRGRDPDVRTRLLERIGPQGTKKAPGPTYGIRSDEWAALACAVTWSDLYPDVGAM